MIENRERERESKISLLTLPLCTTETGVTLTVGGN